MPRGSTVEEQVMRYALVGEMAIKGLREMEVRDVDAVKELFDNYSARWDLAPQFSRDEVEHWLVHKKDGEEVEQILWSYVVEVINLVPSFQIATLTLLRMKKERSQTFSPSTVLKAQYSTLLSALNTQRSAWHTYSTTPQTSA